jgi:hypothetical protein
VSNKTDLKAIIFPGLVSGFLIWLLFTIGRDFFISVFDESRPVMTIIMAFIIVPVLLVITGSVSEKIRKSDPGAGRGLLVPYCAGFTGVFFGCNFVMAGSYATQYVPYLEPGLIPRLAFVSGALIFIFPVVIMVSFFFAGFSLAGGWYVHRNSNQEKERFWKIS